MANHYSHTMQDDGNLTAQQQVISDCVRNNYMCNEQYVSQVSVSPEKVANMIDSLKRDSSPGIDGISSEHLKYGKCDFQA